MRAVVLIVGLLVALPAHADDAATKKQATTHYKLGETYYEAGDFDKAIEEYNAAYALVPEPLLLFNIAQAYRLKGDTRQAVVFYESYLTAEPKGTQAKAVKQYLKELRAKDADSDGLDDAGDACPSDAEDVDAFEDADGCPELDNDADGRADTADLCANEPEDLDGYVDDDGCPEPDNDGDGYLDTRDGCPLDAGPVDGCPETTVTNTEVNELPDDPPLTPTPEDDQPPARPGGLSRALFWVTAGATAATAVGFTLTGLQVRSIEDDMAASIARWDGGYRDNGVQHPDDLCAEADNDGYSELSTLCADQSSMATVTNVLIVSTVVLGGATAYFFWDGYISPPATSETTLRMTPYIGPEGAGISARLNF